jgi:tripartite-type tricarboxylate transporter receptor subunit TctC
MVPKFSALAVVALTVVALTLAASAVAPPARAQPDPAAAYPNRAVKIIVSAPPGGGLDIAARVVADRLAKLWGQPFVVENRPARQLGTEAVAGPSPTVTRCWRRSAPLTTNVVMYKKSTDPAALEPLAIMTRS